LKFFKISDGQFKPVQTAIKRDPQNYLCHCWLSDERVVVATDTGDLLLFDNFEFKAVLANPTEGDESIDCMVRWSKGFLCGGANGTLRVYEQSEDAREHYKSSKVFKIEGNLCRITNLAISPSEDNLACTLENHQMYTLPLANNDILKEDTMNFDLLSTSFHAPGDNADPQVTGLDTCVRKPLVVTCGLDRSVRVWNYLEKTTDLQKTFKEEAYCVAFHPSGLHIVVGFSDKLRLLNLLMDDIRCVKEFPVKACNEVRFSNGGQYFAAVNNNTVYIYHTYSADLITTLRGHNSKVRSVCWKANDKQLYTCGADGFAILWDARHGTKVCETQVSRVQLSCVATSSQDPNTTYVAGNDRKIKEIKVSSGAAAGPTVSGGSSSAAATAAGSAAAAAAAGSMMSVKVDMESNLPIGELHLSASGKVLFAGAGSTGLPGVIRAYNLPLRANDYAEYQCHASPVTRMRMSHDGQFLFTAAMDGSLCVLEVKEAGEKKPAKGRERETPLQFAEEILVTKSDLEEKVRK
jgi:WD40 repeat protein